MPTRPKKTWSGSFSISLKLRLSMSTDDAAEKKEPGIYQQTTGGIQQTTNSRQHLGGVWRQRYLAVDM